MSIAPSATLAVNNKANELRAQGIDIVNFGVGEPDFQTPANVAAKGIEAIQKGFTKYTPSAGIPELRKAIVAKLKRENGLDYAVGQTMACVGAKQAIFLALQVLTGPGDEVMIPGPYWVSYTEMAKLCDATPVFVETTQDEDFKLTPERLLAAVTPRSKAILLNYPHNPTGCSYTRDELKAIADICLAKDIFIISDEVYEHLIYDGGTHTSVASLSPEIYNITVTTNGVSKAYAMTGWRLGYAAGPQDIIAAMIRIQEHMNTNTSSITQYAAVEALNGQQDSVAAMAQEFRKRRDYMYERLSAMPGVKIRKPPGAFYMFPDVSGLFGKTIRGKKITNDMDLVESILSEGHVAVVPGSGFGSPNNIRLSYATSMERITTGMDRMEALLKEAK